MITAVPTLLDRVVLQVEKHRLDRYGSTNARYGTVFPELGVVAGFAVIVLLFWSPLLAITRLRELFRWPTSWLFLKLSTHRRRNNRGTVPLVSHYYAPHSRDRYSHRE